MEFGNRFSMGCGYDKRELDKLFYLPDNMVSVALLSIGYPSDKLKPSPLHSRKYGH